MKKTTLCLHTIHQWPRRDYFHHLTRYQHLHTNPFNTHRSMSLERPTEEATRQDNNQNLGTTTQAPRQTHKPRAGKGKTQLSNKGQTPKHIKGNGTNNGNNTNPTTAQDIHQHPKPRNTIHTTQPRNNTQLGHTSIHSTATSTQHSLLSSQWAKPSTQQTPSTTATEDTADLTQALSQLTTEDSGQATTKTTRPTRSRWRTAKPQRQQQATNPTTLPQAHSTNLRPNTIQPGTTPMVTTRAQRARQTPQTQQQTLKTHKTQRTSGRQRGMTHDSLSWSAS